MKLKFAGALAALAIVLAGTPAAQNAGKADQMPIFQYDHTWPKQPFPNQWALGNVVGVDVDERDHIWVIHRPHTLLQNFENGAANNPPTALCCRPAPPRFGRDAMLIEGIVG